MSVFVIVCLCHCLCLSFYLSFVAIFPDIEPIASQAGDIKMHRRCGGLEGVGEGAALGWGEHLAYVSVSPNLKEYGPEMSLFVTNI